MPGRTTNRNRRPGTGAGRGRIRAGRRSGRQGLGTGSLKRKKMETGRSAAKRARASRQMEEKRKRKERKERNIREAREAAASRVSYVRKPLARRSLFSMGIVTAALLLSAGGFYGGVVTQGQAPLNFAAMGLCSMVLSAAAIWYGAISFLEREKNYVLARAGIGLGILILGMWTVTIVIGIYQP